MIEKNISVLYYRHNKYGCYFGMQKRTLLYYDLTIVFKGQVDYICDNVQYTLNSGDLIFCPVGTVQTRPERALPADYVSFNFIAEDKFELVKTEYLKNAVTNEIKTLIALYDESYGNKSDNTDEKCTLLLKYLILQILDIQKSQSENPLVNKIKKYLHENIDRKITLKDLHEQFFFSPVYCDSVFKKETGFSIIYYLINERVEEAKRLIFEGAYSLLQISEKTGFSDYNYFSRMFKKRTGYSPKKYQSMTK